MPDKKLLRCTASLTSTHIEDRVRTNHWELVENRKQLTFLSTFLSRLANPGIFSYPVTTNATGVVQGGVEFKRNSSNVEAGVEATYSNKRPKKDLHANGGGGDISGGLGYGGGCCRYNGGGSFLHGGRCYGDRDGYGVDGGKDGGGEYSGAAGKGGDGKDGGVGGKGSGTNYGGGGYGCRGRYSTCGGGGSGSCWVRDGGGGRGDGGGSHQAIFVEPESHPPGTDRLYNAGTYPLQTLVPTARRWGGSSQSRRPNALFDMRPVWSFLY